MNNDLPDDFGKIAPQKVCFADKLAGLCGMELSAAKGDPERIGEMIERLTNAVAFTIAIASGGNAARMSEMLEGAESYLYDAATGHEKVGRFLKTPG